MRQFILVIQNEKTRSYRLIRFFILLANAAGMIYIISHATGTREKLWPILSLCGIGLFMLFTFVDVLKKQYSHDTLARMIYIWCAIAWLKTPFWQASLVLVLFFILDILAHRSLLVKVSTKTISYPSFLQRRIEWNELNNLLLKDGLLTIDFKDNKLFQHLIANAETDINEKDFNDFCKAQLKSSAVTTN